MKKKLRFILPFLAALLMSGSLYAAEKWTLDEHHTYVLWRIKHLGFSTQAGKWYAKGFVFLNKENPNKSKVEATIEVAHMITGLPELDKHLKGPLFFDVARYPTAIFTSNAVKLTGKDSATVNGVLTLRGISKPVSLEVTLNKVGVNPISNKTSVGFSATTKIKRSDFGMTTLLPDLADEVTIDIGAEAYLPSALETPNAPEKH